MLVSCSAGWPKLRRLAAGLTLLLLCTLLLRQPTQQRLVSPAAPSEVDTLRQLCGRLPRRGAAAVLTADVQHVLRWVCSRLGEPASLPLTPAGCNKAVLYHPIGRLGNLMGLYAIVYSYDRMFGTTGYVEDNMLSTLSRYFPKLSLQPSSRLPAVEWRQITYQEAERRLACQPGESHAEAQHFLITNYPDRNGIDVFHPFYQELRKEFEFSARLRSQAQKFLRYARGGRGSVTYIGVHVRRTDYEAYIRDTYNGSLPDDAYLNNALAYYRGRFADALFILCSDDLDYVAKRLRARQQDDIVIAGNRDLSDPGRDMALLSACNHSVVTVGTYGFWGAYLAGGTVLVPEQQTHLSRGDRHAPLLEIQLAGANNWVAM